MSLATSLLSPPCMGYPQVTTFPLPSTAAKAAADAAIFSIPRSLGKRLARLGADSLTKPCGIVRDQRINGSTNRFPAKTPTVSISEAYLQSDTSAAELLMFQTSTATTSNRANRLTKCERSAILLKTCKIRASRVIS